MKTFIRKYQIVIFFFAATLILPLAIMNLFLVIGAAPGSTMRFVGTTLIKYSPTIAAFMLVAFTAGRQAIRNLAGRFLIWRVGVNWYVAAILIPLFVDNVIPLGIYKLMGGNAVIKFDISFAAIPATAVLFARFFFAGGGMGEEFGWRGYLTPLLQLKYSVVTTAIIVGILWAAWHFPNYYFGTHSLTEHLYLHSHKILRAVCQAIVYAWIFNRTGGSVLLVAIMHGCVNTFANSHTIEPIVENSHLITEERIVEILAVGCWALTALYLIIRRRQYFCGKPISSPAF